MKKYILLIATGLFLLTACENYLDFPPEGEVPGSEFFVTQEQAVKSVNAIYGYMRSWDISAFNYIILSELPSDNILKGSSPGDGAWALDFDRFQYTPTNGQINGFWSGRYKAINLCNQTITNVPGIDMNAGLKEQLLAEARFLRAFHYFYLVRAFGGVPLVKQVPVGPEGTIRTTEEETWDFIQSELEAVIPLLPATYPESDMGRATSWAAKGMLAKVHLYRQNWEDCKRITDDIIANGGFALHPDFYEEFRPEQELNEESLFEILATQVPGNGGVSNCQYAEVQAVRGQWGWGWFAPTDDLANAFDDAGDQVRKKVTILYRGDVTEDADTIKGIELMENVSIPRYNGKAYVPTRITKETGPYGSDQNIRILRFAEILLMNAEAAHYTGGDVATPLNRVRNRVDLPSIASPTLQDIYLERRLELAGEQDRFWDLVRTGQAATVLGPLGFEPGKHELYPIPQQDIDLSGGELTQNPGW